MKRRFLVEPPLLHIQKPFGSDMYPFTGCPVKGGHIIASEGLYYLYYSFVFLSVVCVCLTLIKGSSFIVAFVLDSTFVVALSDGGKNVLIPFVCTTSVFVVD